MCLKPVLPLRILFDKQDPPPVSVTEADLAELLQAKAAIQAGWTTLLECAGIGPSDLEDVIVAGGFGYHLTPAHAVAIGLLPPRVRKRITKRVPTVSYLH